MKVVMLAVMAADVDRYDYEVEGDKLTKDKVLEIIAKSWNVPAEELDPQQFVIYFSKDERAAYAGLDGDNYSIAVI